MSTKSREYLFLAGSFGDPAAGLLVIETTAQSIVEPLINRAAACIRLGIVCLDRVIDD